MNIFLKSYRFFKRNFSILFLGISVWLVMFTFLTLNLHFELDISKTFNSQEDLEELKLIQSRKKLANKILVSFDFGSIDNNEIKDSCLSEFVALMEDKLKDDVANVKYKNESDPNVFYNYFYSNIPFYFSEDVEQDFKGKLSADSIRKIQENNFNILTGESGIFLGQFIAKDPMKIGAKLLHKSTENLPHKQVDPEAGFILDRNGNPMIISDYTFELLDSDKAKEVRDVFNSLIMEVEAKYDVQVNFYSGFLITLGNSETVRKDSRFTLSVGIGLILILIFLFYRNFFIPILFAVPALFGGLFALGTISLTKGEISMIAIGTGSTVMGIILDFSFHFFTHYRESKSLEKTIRDISTPLIIGSTTTILAFYALTYTSSPILQDFGLFTSLSLIGSIVFILFFYPAILFKLNIKFDKGLKLRIGFPKKLKYGIAFIVLVFAILFIPSVSKLQFDANLRNLNYQSDSLKELEENLNMIETISTSRIYIISQGENDEKSIQSYESVYRLLSEKSSDSGLKRFVSCAPFLVSDSTKKENLKRWQSFVAKNKDSLISSIYTISDSIGFNGTAFQPFYDLLNSDFESFVTENQAYVLNSFQSLIDSIDAMSLMTVVDISRENLDAFKSEIEEIEDLVIIDQSEASMKMVTSVQDDFSFIVLVSSLIVFITLIIIYGRIELALVTFLPMVVSWIIICGIAVLFDIKLNFVNIVVTTFIFGLGDDFAIFITDAYLKLNKSSKKVVESYNTGIFLSAISTIIGTGVLIFSEHPAMKSIALISVIGLIVIFIVSQTLQPVILEILITNRTKKGKPAWTLTTIIASIFSFTYFLLGCVLLFIWFLFLLIFPLPKKIKRVIYRKTFRLFCWSLVYLMVQLKKKTINKELKDFSKPKILIANHSSFLDILVMVLQSDKLVIFTNDWVYKSPFFGIQIQFAGYLQASKGVEANLKAIKERVAEGCSVVIFPEGTRSSNGKIKRFHKGAFFLAEKLQIPIQPVLLHGMQYTMSKGDFMLKTGQMTIKYLPEITPDDAQWGERYQERAKSISKYFKQEFEKLRDELETAKYFQNQITNSFAYTNPMIENYVKVKYRIERKTYNLILKNLNTSSLIYDLGCGLGYMSYLIRLKNPETEIVGTDYDGDKIEVARNNYINKNKKAIQFETNDISEIIIKPCSTIILGDVLHYLSTEKKIQVLNNCCENLEMGGRLIIREGIVEEDGHNNTRLTEKISTEYLEFNKKEGQLDFISDKLIQWLVDEKKLSLINKTKLGKNSNYLFVFEKQ